jgi:hypothetical protein
MVPRTRSGGSALRAPRPRLMFPELTRWRDRLLIQAVALVDAGDPAAALLAGNAFWGFGRQQFLAEASAELLRRLTEGGGHAR